MGASVRVQDRRGPVSSPLASRSAARERLARTIRRRTTCGSAQTQLRGQCRKPIIKGFETNGATRPLAHQHGRARVHSIERAASGKPAVRSNANRYVRQRIDEPDVLHICIEAFKGSCQHVAVSGTRQCAAKYNGNFHEQKPRSNLGLRLVQDSARFTCSLLSQIQFEQHARIDVDHRNQSSDRTSSRIPARSIPCGTPTTGPAPGLGTFRRGKRTFPAIASRASASSSETVGAPTTGGGASCATTRPRSVTSTVSPSATTRRYSLNLFLSSRTPAALIGPNVAPSATSCKLRSRACVDSGAARSWLWQLEEHYWGEG